MSKLSSLFSASTYLFTSLLLLFSVASFAYAQGQGSVGESLQNQRVLRDLKIGAAVLSGH